MKALRLRFAAAGGAAPTRGWRWKLNRLSRMGAGEIGYRLQQHLHAAAQARGFGLALSPPQPQGGSGNNWLASGLDGFEPARGVYLQEADQILAGYFNIFALRGEALGFPPVWNRDPRTGIEAPLSFGKTLNYRDNALVGDIKYLWEPNRHLELVRLAQAWKLSGQAKYLLGVQTLLDSWLTQCPYPRGANWTSSLELAVRLLNWSVVWQLIGAEQSPLFSCASGQQFRERWLASVYQHCHFINGHYSRFSSANNHLLGEYMGLFAAAVTWPLWPASAKWQSIARRGLEREALRQVGADGVNREQASWYHHEVADMLLLCALLSRANGIEFSRDYWQRLEGMLTFIDSLMDRCGNVPMIGDSDDAVMVDFDGRRDVYRSLLASGGVLFERPEWCRKAGHFDNKSRWLLGDDGAAKFDALQAAPAAAEPQRRFPDGGYYLLGDKLGQPGEVRILVDAGPLGYLSLAAHGHADALAFTLSLNGIEVLIDPGTYAYHTQQRWRDYFRGTAAHNTLRIDACDQSVVGGNFMWLHHARAGCDNFETTPQRDSFSGWHDGYRRLADPVTHRRSLEYDKQRRRLTVTDRLECRASHEVELHWHLGEHCRVALDGQVATIDTGEQQLRLCLPENPGLGCDLIRGDSAAPLGWVSRAFDVKQPCNTLRCSGRITGGIEMQTVFELAGEHKEP